MAARLIRFILKCACCTCRHFSVPFFLFLYNFLFHRINSRVNSSVIFHLFIHLFKLSIAFWLTVSCGHFSYSHEKHMRFGYNNNENDWEIGEWMFVSVMWIMIYNKIHRSVEFRMPKSNAELYIIWIIIIIALCPENNAKRNIPDETCGDMASVLRRNSLAHFTSYEFVKFTNRKLYWTWNAGASAATQIPFSTFLEVKQHSTWRLALANIHLFCAVAE